MRTDRLLLRPLSAEDIPEWHRNIYSDPEVTRYLPVEPMPLEWMEGALGRVLAHWGEHGFGAWAVELADTGTFVGQAGLRAMDEVPGEIEVAYRFGRDHWGKGYATECARASVQFGFERFGFGRILGFAVHENRASRRVMEKLGFAYERDEHLFGLDVSRYVLARERFDPGDAAYEVLG